MAKKMTMADIASLSGVGKSTVSRYFNGGYVKDETRAKIQKVIEEYNYTPNAFARLNAKQSNVIGVVVPTLNSKITSRESFPYGPDSPSHATSTLPNP